MKKKYIFLILLLFTINNFSQKKDNPNSNWKNDITVGLNLGQIAYSNWTKGGDNQFSWNFVFLCNSKYEKKNYKWQNILKINYGRNKTGKEVNKVSQNDLLFNSLFSYKSGWFLNYFAGINLITQIAPGYDYSNKPYKQVNSFFDPSDLTESIGFVFSKKDNFKSQLGLGFHQIFAKNFYYRTDKPAPGLEKSIYETGIESITTFKWNFAENILWQTYLRLFSAFDRLDTWDIRWDNTITGKINSLINVNFSWLVVYDVKQTKKTQIKEALQVGISYKLL